MKFIAPVFVLAFLLIPQAQAFHIQHCFPKDEKGFSVATIKRYFCTESEKLNALEVGTSRGEDQQKVSQALKDLALHIDKFLRNEDNGIKPIFDKTDKKIAAQKFNGDVNYSIRYSPADTPCGYSVVIDSRLNGTKVGEEVYASSTNIKLKKMETRCLIDPSDPNLKLSATRMGTELHNGLRKVKVKSRLHRVTHPFDAKSE